MLALILASALALAATDTSQVEVVYDRFDGETRVTYDVPDLFIGNERGEWFVPNAAGQKNFLSMALSFSCEGDSLCHPRRMTLSMVLVAAAPVLDGVSKMQFLIAGKKDHVVTQLYQPTWRSSYVLEIVIFGFSVERAIELLGPGTEVRLGKMEFSLDRPDTRARLDRFIAFLRQNILPLPRQPDSLRWFQEEPEQADADSIVGAPAR